MINPIKVIIYISILLSHIFTSSLFANKRVDRKSKWDSSPSRREHFTFFSTSNLTQNADRQKEADQLRIQTISSIQKLINSPGVNGHRKFELYLRLGELYAERSEYLKNQEMADYTSSHELWSKNGKKGKEPEVNTKASHSELLKASDAFRRLVREFPKHPRTDAALYSLSKMLLLLNNDNAVLYLNQLVQNHKQSPILPEAYVALGEYYFFKHDMESAKANYKKAIEFKQSNAYPFALYKLAWTYYNTASESKTKTVENIDKAIASLQLTIKVAEKSNEQGKILNLRQEAISDLIMVYAETERVDEAIAYFSRLGDKTAFYDMLERLGDHYEENGVTRKAIEVYTRLLKESPLRPRNPEICSKLAKLYDTSFNVKAVVETVKFMQVHYASKGSPWYEANMKQAELIKESTESVRKNIHRFATTYHKEGQKLKKPEYYAAAAELYRLYISNYSGSDEAYELRYYLADIYFSEEKFENAADEYLKVSQLQPKEGKYLKSAAINAVAAMEKLDTLTKYQKLPALGQAPQPIEIPRIKKKFVDVMDNYTTLLPHDTDGHALRFSAAMIYFEHGQYEEALKRFDAIAMGLPDTPQGRDSIKLILGFHENQREWIKLVEKSRRFLTNQKLTSIDLRTYINKVLKNSTFQLATEQAKNGQHLDAARNFEGFQKQFPQDENADKALYNASVSYYKIAKVEEALAAGLALIKNYPKSKLTGDTMLDMAQTHESLANFPQAAILYKTFSFNSPKDPRSRGAMFKSALLYRGLKDHQQSIIIFKQFIQNFPKDELVSRAYFEMGEIAEISKNYPEAMQYYSQHANYWPEGSEKTLLARSRVADLQLRHGSQKDGHKEIRKLYHELTTKNAPAAIEARRLIAGAMFSEQERDFSEFMKIGISSAAKIELEVKTKQSKLLGNVKRYQDIIALGSGQYTVAALFRMGEMHENFAKVLFDAPNPENATQSQIEEYKSNLEKVAFPLKDEAKNFFEAAFTRTQEVQTFTDWTSLSYEKMSEIQPERYPFVQEKSLAATYMSHKLQWDPTLEKLAN